jgi:hypothetical protein
MDQTKGYRYHPQLARFRQCRNPIGAIGAYLWGVHDEAVARGYRFDAGKIAQRRVATVITVTRGQLAFEWEHLRRKLSRRDRMALRRLDNSSPTAHPMMRTVAGGVEDWEII